MLAFTFFAFAVVVTAFAFVLVFVFSVEIDIFCHKRAVLLKNGENAMIVKVFLAVCVDMRYDVCSVRFSFRLGCLVFAGFGAGPMDGGRVRKRLCYNLNLVRSHKRGIEAEPEMPDYACSAFLGAFIF